jgi:hypothetical protein
MSPWSARPSLSRIRSVSSLSNLAGEPNVGRARRDRGDLHDAASASGNRLSSQPQRLRSGEGLLPGTGAEVRSECGHEFDDRGGDAASGLDLAEGGRLRPVRHSAASINRHVNAISSFDCSPDSMHDDHFRGEGGDDQGLAPARSDGVSGRPVQERVCGHAWVLPPVLAEEWGLAGQPALWDRTRTGRAGGRLRNADQAYFHTPGLAGRPLSYLRAGGSRNQVGVETGACDPLISVLRVEQAGRPTAFRAVSVGTAARPRRSHRCAHVTASEAAMRFLMTAVRYGPFACPHAPPRARVIRSGSPRRHGCSSIHQRRPVRPVRAVSVDRSRWPRALLEKRGSLRPIALRPELATAFLFPQERERQAPSLQ